jgi:creatinine amidohydrolase/Fe(II)-dependent formamide hydrolase-like protein
MSRIPSPAPARAALLLSLLLAALPARAAAPDTVWLEALTSTEVGDLVRHGTTTIILPVGGVEQSGPDIALGKHDARVSVLAERIARALGHTLVAPVMPFVPEGNIDPPTSHMRFPGTLTIPADVFRKTMTSVAASLARHGFRSIVLIGDHGGYQGDLAAVAADLDRRWAGTPARAHYIADYYRAATADFTPVLRARGYATEEIGTHAGLADTSLTLAIAPAAVREEGLKAGTDLDAAHGVYGDPRRSSAAVGQIGADAIVARTVSAIRAATARDPRP